MISSTVCSTDKMSRELHHADRTYNGGVTLTCVCGFDDTDACRTIIIAQTLSTNQHRVLQSFWFSRSQIFQPAIFVSFGCNWAETHQHLMFFAVSARSGPKLTNIDLCCKSPAKLSRKSKYDRTGLAIAVWQQTFGYYVLLSFGVIETKNHE